MNNVIIKDGMFKYQEKIGLDEYNTWTVWGTDITPEFIKEHKELIIQEIKYLEYEKEQKIKYYDRQLKNWNDILKKENNE